MEDNRLIPTQTVMNDDQTPALVNYQLQETPALVNYQLQETPALVNYQLQIQNNIPAAAPPMQVPQMQVPNVPFIEKQPSIQNEKKNTVSNLPTTATGFKNPTNIRCPHCKTAQRTYIEFEIGTNTILLSACLCFLIPCFSCVPCCTEATQDQVHFCKSCQREVGRNKYILFRKR